MINESPHTYAFENIDKVNIRTRAYKSVSYA